MSLKAAAIGVTLLWAAPAFAQERGTVEFGAFGSAGTFNKSLTLDHGIGGGGRVGVFMDPRIALEFEKGEMRANRTLGLANVNVGIVSSRLVVSPLTVGPVAVLLGAGAGASTETNFLHSYGVNALLGAKVALNENIALRIDGIADWLANNDWKSYQRVQVGLSFYRRPNQSVRMVEVTAPAPVFVQRPDSVSADEQRRRRRGEENYNRLRDSLNRSPAAPSVPASSESARASMEERIHFATDKSELTPEAKTILDAKVRVFLANPAMRITIAGNTDSRASDAYNMELGSRRSEAAKAYLVAKGIDAARVEVSTLGERKPAAAGESTAAQAANRRDEFRLLVGSDYLVAPKP